MNHRIAHKTDNGIPPRPLVIPFFLPNQGCPHRCIYCDQHATIGPGADEEVSPEHVAVGVSLGLNSRRRKPGQKVEVAFYGGTFTALPLERQAALLEAVAPFIMAGQIHGLRLSTRPDRVTESQIDFLKIRGVTAIELGAQSLDDRVLSASHRGHSADQTRTAARIIQEAGLRLGVQLLLGLPEEDQASRELTLKSVLELAPAEVRLYPLLVLKGTALGRLYQQGKYQPLTLDQAVAAAAAMLAALTAAGITVTRIGLQDTPDLKDHVLAGPYHPAMGELVKSRLFLRVMLEALTNQAGHQAPLGDKTIFYVAPRDLSAAIGHGRTNLSRLTEVFPSLKITIRPDGLMPFGRIQLSGETKIVYGP